MPVKEQLHFLNLLKKRQTQRKEISNEVFDSLAERQKRMPKNIGRTSKELLLILDSLGINSPIEKKYVLQGLRKARIMFGNKLTDPAYFKDTIEHLRAEFELLKTQKNLAVVLRLGISPFQILDINHEISALPKEYSDLSNTIRGLVLRKVYPNVSALIIPMQKISSFLKGLSLSRGLKIKIIQYTFNLKNKKNTFEEAFDKALKYFTLPLKFLSLDARTNKGDGKSYHEKIGTNENNPLKLLSEKDNQILLEKLSVFLGERYNELISHLEEHDTLPNWAI